MTRLNSNRTGFRLGDSSGAGFNLASDRPSVDLSAVPSLREYAGLEGEVNANDFMATPEGRQKLGDFTSFLRDQWEIAPAGTPGRRELYDEIKRLEQERAQAESISTFAEERGVSFEAANVSMGSRGFSPYLPREVSFLLTHAGRGIEKAGETVAQAALRIGVTPSEVLGAPEEVKAQERAFEAQTSANIYREGRRKDEVLVALERGPDGFRERYGDLTADVVGSITETVPRMAAEAQLGGTPLVFFDMFGSNYVDGLVESGENEAYALGKATIETGLTWLLGAAGRAVGLNTLEESLTPAVRAVAKNLAERTGLGRIVNMLAGQSLEGIEENVISQLHGLMDVAFGVADTDDPHSELVSTLAGVFSAAGVDATKAIADFSKRSRDTMKGVRDVEAALQSHTVNTLADPPPGPLADPGAEPPTETGIPSHSTIALDTPDAVVEAQTGVQLGEGGAVATRPAVYPEDVDARIQQARAKEFIDSLTPEKLDSLLSTREVAMPAPAEQPGEVAAPQRPLAAAMSTLKKLIVGEGSTSTETALPSGEITSETDTAQQNFLELTGIPNTSVDYRDAFLDTLEFYRAPIQPAMEAKAVAQTLSGSPLKSRTREEIRVTAAKNKLATARQRISDMKMAARQRAEVREEWLADAGQLVQDNVPPELRGRFIDGIAKAKTPRRFIKLIDRIDRWAEKNEREVARHEFQNSLRDAKNISAEARATIDSLLSGVDFGTKKRRRQAEALKNELAEADSSVPLSSEQEELLELLDRKHIKDFTADELRDLTEAVQSATFVSKYSHLMRAVDREIALDDLGKVIVEEAKQARKLSQTKAAGLDRLKPPSLRSPDLEADAHRPNLPLTPGQTLDAPFFREWAMRPEAVMEYVSGALSNQAWENLFIQGKARHKALMRGVTERFGAVLDDLGLSWRRGTTVFGMGGKLTSRLEEWREARARVGGVTMTRGEALQLAVMMMDSSNGAVMREYGVNIEGRKTRFLKIDDDAVAGIVEFLGEEGSALAQHMFSEYNSSIIDPVNQEWEINRGHPLTLRKQHVPRQVADDAIDYKDPTTFQQQLVDTTLDAYRHTKKREGTRKPLVVRADGIDSFMKHADRMLRIAAYLNVHRDTIAMLQREDVQGAIKSIGGDATFNAILDRVNRQVLPKQAVDQANSFVKFVNRNSTFIRLALRIGAVVKQSAGLVLSAGQTPGGFRRLLQTAPDIVQQRGSAKARMMGSPVAWDRFEVDRYMHEYAQGNVFGVGYFRPEPASNVLLAPIMLAEREVTGPWRRLQAEQYVREQGIADDDPRFAEEASREWERMMARSENSSDGMEQTGLQAFTQDHPLAYSGTQFSSSASRVYSAFAQGLDKFRAGDKKAGLTLMSGAAVSTVLTAAIDDLLSREDVEGDWPERMAKRFALGTVSTHPFGDELGETFLRRLMGMKVYSYDDASLLSLGVNITDAAGRLAESWIASDDPDKTAKALADLIEESSILTRVPVGGLRDLYRRAVSGDWLPGIQREDNES